MDLKDFIKETISSISTAILESQEELKDHGVIVNPEKLETGKTGEKILRSDGWRYVQELDFEISIGIEKINKEGGGGKLTVANLISIGMDATQENQNLSQNKIKFKIPIAFPSMETPTKYKRKGKGVKVN